MTHSSLTKTEAAILYLTCGVLIFGIVMANLDQAWYDLYFAAEDGFIEWMTVLPLLLICLVTVRRIRLLASRRSPWFLAAAVFLICFCLFAIGEEISWGQRLLQTKSPAFFKPYNAQKETNLHNLVIQGRSVNLIVFSRLMIVAMSFYLLALPVLYGRVGLVRSWVDTLGIPLPKPYQVLALFVVFGLISFIPSGKRAEMLEFGACFMLLSIVMFPRNPQVFQP
ncbi:MAG: hypothetical protein ACO1NZ_15525 [Adhaeribacter sp.]